MSAERPGPAEEEGRERSRRMNSSGSSSNCSSSYSVEGAFI
jgi:hypothetical protein